MNEDRIKKLEMQLFSEKALRQSLEETVSIHFQRQNSRIKQLEAALEKAARRFDEIGQNDDAAEIYAALEGKE